MMPGRRRIRLVFAVYLACIVAVTLFGAGALVAREMRKRVEERLDISGTWFADHDANLGLVLAPNAATHYRDRTLDIDFHIYTDERGLRVGRPGDATPSEVDLLLVGGSFFMGWGVEHEDSIAGRLQAGTSLRVANAGVPAVGTLTSARQVRRFADLEPEVVAYGFIDRHLQRNTCPCAAEHAGPYCQAQTYVAFDDEGRPYAHAPLESFFAPHLGSRYTFDAIVRDESVVRGAYWGVRSVLAFLYHRYHQTCLPERKRDLRAFDFAVGEFVKATREIDAEPVFVYIPEFTRYPYLDPEILSRLRKIAEVATVVDLTPDVRRHLSRAGQPKMLRFLKDFHPSPTGHALMAEGICRVMAARGALEAEDCAVVGPSDPP